MNLKKAPDTCYVPVYIYRDTHKLNQTLKLENKRFAHFAALVGSKERQIA